jgi:Flp pilus assembly protein TadB
MSYGRYVEALQRKKAISAALGFVVCACLLLWHGPSFPLAVVTLIAGLYLIANVLGLRRLRRDSRER